MLLMTDSTPIFALAYASRSSSDLQNADLEAILVDASAQNRIADVTGVLLYDGTSFLQYLEGPDEGVASVFDRIKRSSRHADIRVLFSGEVSERYFWNWSMACQHADASLIQRIEAALPRRGWRKQPSAATAVRVLVGRRAAD